MSLNKVFIRQFSGSGAVLRAGYSTVQPVHHLVKVNKAALKPLYQGVLLPKDDIKSVSFKPTEISQDRVAEHYQNTLKSDLLLHNYEHGATTLKGNKKRSWGEDSPYKLYRNLKKPKGVSRPSKDVHPIRYDNVPEVESIVIQSYNKDALDESWLNISTRLQLAQITNVKPKQIYSKANILPWRVRQGKPCGGKVEITGRDMTQFISTLTELVLPRIRTFQGIKNTSGDSNGNITFGLDPEDVKGFPEIENFQELFPNLSGLQITFKTNAGTDERARTLLSSLGFPFYNP
ncbi:ribosomal protein L5 domain-containing protein [Scheffersomyces xylosifermentans]|uniref:ribosomal protein L5 domain-containing protein n=1 Tax=Scheffersomyces xylosifermentans TaxID=1304137 RepID=UPI00315D9579